MPSYASGLIVSLSLLLGACSRNDSRLNVLFFTLDTTRADHIGCYGHDGIRTPHIDAMAAAGIRYDSAFSPVPITLPAHTSMLTGTYPIYHGVRENGGFYVPEDAETLAEILKAAGYQTGAFVGAFPLDSQTGIDQGFDEYDDHYPSSLENRHPRLRRFYDERPAADVKDAALAWLDGSDRRPFFVWAHFFDPHHPLLPPTPFREQYPGSAYDAEIASVDAAIGEILTWLEQRDDLDNTLVIIAADHGEGHGEHGEETHALLLYSSTLRVPLIVRDPREQGGAVVTTPVTTVDIFATVLDRLGLPIPEHNQGFALPRSDADGDPERKIYSETMFGRLIYGWSPLERLTIGSQVLIRSSAEPHLYERQNDPDELADLAKERPEQVATNEAQLEEERAWLAWEGLRFSRGEDRVDLDQAAMREAMLRLESLGYVGSAVQGDDLDDAIDPGRPDPLAMMDVFNLHNEGNTLLDAGQLDLAASVLGRARERDPGNPAVLQALAQAHLGRGDPSRARSALESLLAVNDSDVRTLLVLSQLHVAVGELTEAVALLEAAVAMDPGDVATRLQLAHLLEDAGEPDRARAVYRDLLAIDAGHALGMNGLATLLYRSGDYDEAASLLEEVLAQQPFYAPAWLNLGVVELARDDREAALQAAERALALRPGYAQAKALRSRISEPGDG